MNYMAIEKDYSICIFTGPVADCVREMYPQEFEMMKPFLTNVDQAREFTGPSLDVEEVESRLAGLMAFITGKENMTLYVEKFECYGKDNQWTAVLHGYELVEGGV